MCRASRILLLAIAISGGCRGLPQRPSLPATHQTPDHQLVFHCDFELAPEHRLVRELNDEREYIGTTLGLSPSTERIDVYLFRDSGTYGRYLAQRFPKVPPRRAFFVAALLVGASSQNLNAIESPPNDGKLRIVVFGAHPDDAEYKAGGVGAKWAKQGHHVLLCSVTNGSP